MITEGLKFVAGGLRDGSPDSRSEESGVDNVRGQSFEGHGVRLNWLREKLLGSSPRRQSR